MRSAKHRFKVPPKTDIWLIISVLTLAALGLLVWLNFTKPVATIPPKPPLKVPAEKHKLQIGNFAILNHIYEPDYSDILTRQFHFVLANNTPNWYFTDGGLRPSRTSFNFKQMDEVVAYAEKHAMPVQAHHFVWGGEKWLPEWL